MEIKGADKFKTLLRKQGASRYILVIGLVGIVLIGLSSLRQPSQETSAEEAKDTTEAYTQRLEEQLEGMVSSIEGAGNTRVMVTLENGVKYVYANEEKTNSDHTTHDSGSISDSDDSHRTVVTIDGGDGKEGLLVTEIQPTVRGVVVACEGADDEHVCDLVRQAVKTALAITDKRVCVIPYYTKGADNG